MSTIKYESDYSRFEKKKRKVHVLTKSQNRAMDKFIKIKKFENKG